MDIEHTGHLIAVLRTESACREAHIIHHLGIDEAQTFLLAATDQQGTVHLDAVDIDLVLVETTATHVVLTTQFVVLVHAGKGDQYTLYRTTGSIRHQPCRAGIYLVHRPGRMLHSAHFHFLYPLLIRRQADIDIENVLIADDTLLGSDITDHREDKVKFRFLKREGIIAIFVGSRALNDAFCTLRGYVNQFYSAVIYIRHVPIHAHYACMQARCRQ